MKNNAQRQLKSKNTTDLKKQVEDFKDNLWQLKNDLASGKVKNVKKIKVIKKNIARVLTILNN